MAKINKLQKSGVTIYPATIPQAVIDSETGKTQKEVNDDVVEVAKTLKQVEDDTSVKIENLVENGDFRNGQGDWSVYLGTIISLENNVLTFLADSSSAHLSPRFGETIEDSVLYINVGVKTLSQNVGIHLGYINRVLYTGEGNWQTLSYRFNISAGSRPLVGISQFAADSFSEISVRDYKVINLTQTFGAGNEPTKEEMDLLISILGIEYFEGEITIPAQKIMQWQLALIRKNKNAIIALGGTII